MDRNFGTVLFRCKKHARVGNQDGVGAEFRKLPEVARSVLKITVMRENIGRNIYLRAMLPGVFDSFFHFVRREILRFRSEAKSVSSDINRVSAIANRRL